MSLKVDLPSSPTQGRIIVYLTEKEVERPHQVSTNHYIVADLDEDLFDYLSTPDEMAGISIWGITPGTYEVHALWDKVEPFNGGEPPFVAEAGDFVQKEAAEIEIKAGIVTRGVSLQCTELID